MSWTMEEIRTHAMLDGKCDYWNDGSEDCETCRTPMRGDCWNRMCLDLVDKAERAVVDAYERAGVIKDAV